jgi:rSAM/selenodomain-associated transferase 2
MVSVSDSSRLSVIIPTLNEAGEIGAALEALEPLRAGGCEVVVVDGGSGDGTAARAERGADRVLRSAPGRALQMNAGAAAAGGEVLLFLHADTRLPSGAVEAVLNGLQQGGRGWGFFAVRLSGAHPALRVVERMMGMRSRLTAIATGDQAIFVRRDWFQRVGGFPAQPLMEDVALSARLRQLGPPLSLRQRVTTSSRRWETRGIARTVLLMWRLRLAYWRGVDPERLAERYR